MIIYAEESAVKLLLKDVHPRYLQVDTKRQDFYTALHVDVQFSFTAVHQSWTNRYIFMKS